jgi:hypothetical protein
MTKLKVKIGRGTEYSRRISKALLQGATMANPSRWRNYTTLIQISGKRERLHTSSIYMHSFGITFYTLP